MASDGGSDANSRINGYWEKFAIWVCGAILALLIVGFQDQSSKVDRMEERLQFLYMDKVSKNELKDVEARIMNRIEAGNSDILARIDLYFKRDIR